MIKRKSKNNIIILLLVILLTIFSIISPLQTFCSNQDSYKIAEDLNMTIIDELEQIDFSGLNQIVDDFQSKKTNIFSLDNIKNKVYSIISGENAISYENLFASLFSNIIEIVIKYLPLLSIIIAIGVISNLLNGIKSKFNEKSTSNLIHIVCFMTVIILTVGIIS